MQQFQHHFRDKDITYGDVINLRSLPFSVVSINAPILEDEPFRPSPTTSRKATLFDTKKTISHRSKKTHCKDSNHKICSSMLVAVGELASTERVEPSCTLCSRGSSVALGALASVNVTFELRVERAGDMYGCASVRLREVPLFLVSAFGIVRANRTQMGLFRRSGNARRIATHKKRLADIFCGRTAIPADLNWLDVCSLVKLFLTRLEKPVLCCAATTSRLLRLGERRMRGECVNAQHVQDAFEPPTLPEAHRATLAYLCRELREIAACSSRNGMNATNLATCLAPTLLPSSFRDAASSVAGGGAQVAMATIAVLIEHALSLSLSRDSYLSSRRRSASASSRHPTVAATAAETRPLLPAAVAPHRRRSSSVASRLSSLFAAPPRPPSPPRRRTATRRLIDLAQPEMRKNFFAHSIVRRDATNLGATSSNKRHHEHRRHTAPLPPTTTDAASAPAAKTTLAATAEKENLWRQRHRFMQSEKKATTRSVTDDFALNGNAPAIVRAQNSEELPSAHDTDARPSVAFLHTQRRGLVRDRILLFNR